MKKTTWHILATGLSFDEDEIYLSDYLKIVKLQNKLSVFDLAAAGSKGFREWAMLEPIAVSCNFEIVSTQNPKLQKGYDSLNRAWLLNTLLVLRRKLKINSLACSTYSWNNVAGISKTDKKLEEFEGNLLDFHTKFFTLPAIQEDRISTADIKWVKKYFEIANSLAAQDDNFRFGIETINSWRFAKDYRSSIAILWAAIESIIGVSSEITFKLSLSVSSLLIDRGELRKIKFNQIKKLYGLRSKVVHGSDLKSTEIEKAISESYLLLCDLINYMIEKNKVITKQDLEKAIFY